MKSKIACKSDMGETLYIIHPETQFFSSCKFVKVDESCTSKNTMVGQAQARLGTPTSNGRKRKEESGGHAGMGPKESQS